MQEPCDLRHGLRVSLHLAAEEDDALDVVLLVHPREHLGGALGNGCKVLQPAHLVERPLLVLGEHRAAREHGLGDAPSAGVCRPGQPEYVLPARAHLSTTKLTRE